MEDRLGATSPTPGEPPTHDRPELASAADGGGSTAAAEATVAQTAWQQRRNGLKARGTALAKQANHYVEALRTRSRIVDVGFRVYDRDRDAAGTLLGSALALRLFLFFVPMVLLMVGLAGLVGRHADYDSLSDDARIGGSIGRQIDSAFSQGSNAPWFACAAGLLGMATTGWSLSKALIVSSALSWQLGGRQKAGARVVGIVVGLIVGIGLLTVLINRIRDMSGVAVASISFAAVLWIYVVLWLLVFQTLPRATTDPGASIPGAFLTGVTLTGMQMISVLYLPGAVERSSELYGAIGITLATLGWFFIIGRVAALSFSLNAVIFEELGSVSGIVFAIPGIRWIPRRYEPVARYFDLTHTAESADDTAEPTRSSDGSIPPGGPAAGLARVNPKREPGRDASASADPTPAPTLDDRSPP